MGCAVGSLGIGEFGRGLGTPEGKLKGMACRGLSFRAWGLVPLTILRGGGTDV